ncbi:hypothetical protein J2S25_002931 [Mesobacillus stamsii]|uniref:Uncharacterized protein n=1 Tax=Mesobacillus stamsii TaxID=225347 RepID=A0ABU0FXP6_9BACI|nr:hypothetical protein [Mesobacillus stamsii]
MKNFVLTALIILILVIAGGWFFMRGTGGMKGNMP